MTENRAEKYYKVLNEDGTCYHGGNGKWPLPVNGKPGKWMPKIEGKLVPCRNGYHIIKREDIPGWLGPAIFEVEVEGELKYSGNKGVVRRARLLRKNPHWGERAYRLWCCDCSEMYKWHLAKENIAEYERIILTIRAHAFGLASEVDMKWARAGARAGTWARAWDNREQLNRLFDYLDGKVDLIEMERTVKEQWETTKNSLSA